MNISARIGRTPAFAAFAAAFALCASGCGDKGAESETWTGAFESVNIGGKVWMAKNLNHEAGNSWCYRDDSGYCEKYGRLYDWNTAKKVCPSGWRLPTVKDWDDLAAAASADPYEAGTKLKTKSGWAECNGFNGNGTDDGGFSALPGGTRFSDGGYGGTSADGYWWTAEEKDSVFAYYRNMTCKHGRVVASDERKVRGHSVRCVKN